MPTTAITNNVKPLRKSFFDSLPFMTNKRIPTIPIAKSINIVARGRVFIRTSARLGLHKA